MANSNNLVELKMRDEMRNFIDREADLTTFAKVGALFFGDHDQIEEVHSEKLGAALLLGDLGWCKRKMHEIASAMDLSVEIDSVISTQQAAARDDDQSAMQNIILSAMGECSLNSTAKVVHQNASNCIIHPPFIISAHMRNRLHSRLIRETLHSLTNLQKQHMQAACIDITLTAQRDDDNWSMPANWKEEHACSRERFLARARLQPPPVLRVIDIEATCINRERVVLLDYDIQQGGYTAISHTYGMDVYEVFNCRCATECSSKVRPRSWEKPCPHHEHQVDRDASAAGTQKHKRIVKDMLRMCDILRKSGVHYAWHDGVCIAQHHESEVNETIQHMGWIYANANETVIFLHYVGKPMAPIRNSNFEDELVCRWHTRVWTLQEGALSKCRRYCVRVGDSRVGDCQSLEEFEEKIALWDHSSSIVEIMEEEKFFEFLKEIDRVLSLLRINHANKFSMVGELDVIVQSHWVFWKAQTWLNCIKELIGSLRCGCFEFPTVDTAIMEISGRESKHVGDRINSILALAEVKGFVAFKDVNMEASTIEFFKRQGELGLARAVFTFNYLVPRADRQYVTEVRRHTWPPILWRQVEHFETDWDDLVNCIGFKVLEDGDERMELTGELLSVKVQFTMKRFNTHENTSENHTPSCSERMQLMEAAIRRQDLSYLAMDLYFAYTRAASCEATLSGCSPSTVCMKMGEVRVSYFRTQECQPDVIFVAPWSVEEGTYFDAHLVIPARTRSRTGLIVQGDMQYSQYNIVSKIGAFLPTDVFSEWLFHQHGNALITPLDSLVII